MLKEKKTYKDNMLVGDLVENREFDVNCNFEIYDCTEKGSDWQNEGWVIPNDKILAMRVQYIALDIERKALVIEAGKVA